MKIHNFSAGPAILPEEVLRKSAQAVINFNDSGLSLLEMSHRSKDFEDVMDKARQLVKELLQLEDRYEVLFLQGGASTQFYMTALNLLTPNGFGAYVNTGTWASLAIGEAKRIGKVEVLASSEADQFRHIPKGYDIPANADYLHLTSNNTIYGTQMHAFPKSPVPVVCDMSSDIFSRPFQANDFGLIYAGAQKNMGPAGVTMVIVDKNLLGKTGRSLPTMLDYQVHASKESMFNTPPVFPIYVTMLTMQWLKDNGGLPWIGKVNEIKASTFYQALDANPCFKGTVATEDRSWMNATFLLTQPELEKEFESMLKEAGISGLKGHRSVGGYRASMYNALPLESVKVLVNVMDDFAQKFA